MQENFELVQRGFRILVSSMSGYIGRELNRIYKNAWWNEVLSTLSTCEFRNELEAEKATFTENVIKKVKTIDNIFKIVVSRYYGAWGESSELLLV